MAIKRY